MLLAEGAQINDKLHRLPTENTAFIPNGVYRFKTQEDANKHQLDCLAKGITKVALERRPASLEKQSDLTSPEHEQTDHQVR